MAESQCPITNDPLARAAAEKNTNILRAGFPPGLSQPALRALAAAGLTNLESLDGFSKATLLAMHGIGPKGVRILESALAENGGALSD